MLMLTSELWELMGQHEMEQPFSCHPAYSQKASLKPSVRLSMSTPRSRDFYTYPRAKEAKGRSALYGSSRRPDRNKFPSSQH